MFNNGLYAMTKCNIFKAEVKDQIFSWLGQKGIEKYFKGTPKEKEIVKKIQCQ